MTQDEWDRRREQRMAEMAEAWAPTAALLEQPRAEAPDFVKPMPEAKAERYTHYIGTRWGEWHVLELAGEGKRREVYVWCECKCGDVRAVRLSKLTCGETRRCRACGPAASAETRWARGASDARPPAVGAVPAAGFDEAEGA